MRDLYPGIGQAVGERTVLRQDVNGVFEEWRDAAHRTALGNAMLDPNCGDYEKLFDHTSNGRMLWSGRHLQHGDVDQPTRNMEVFTNCSTAATCALSFGLLLQGSGVGRCYDDDMMHVDWDMAPMLFTALVSTHPDVEDADGVADFIYDERESPNTPNKYEDIVWHDVEDSREGWMKALEIYETMTFNKEAGKALVLDFSKVRGKDSPIMGMQGRPSCGPVPTMRAFQQVRDKVVGCGHDVWFQNMLVDHYFAESVQVGGARRSARIAVKNWRDEGIFDFIDCKSKYDLWTANNSVGVDEEFWDDLSEHKQPSSTPLAVKVFDSVTNAAYHHGTGEPGFLNLHMLPNNEEGLDWEELYKGEWAGSSKYQFEQETKVLHGLLARSVHKKKYKFIVNPCAEITLFILGGFCVIGDVVPYHCETLDQFTEVACLMARALIRVNTMDSIYKTEVLRTNRIGVSLTGLHEWLWARHRMSFVDVTGDIVLAGLPGAELEFVRHQVEKAAREYSDTLGLNHPHTFTTIKPAGTTSKLFGLTEGCHLPSMSVYLRWVQFNKKDPLVKEYEGHGYPVKELQSRRDMMLVGFPTRLPFGEMDLGDKLRYAGDATMEEQFEWLRWLEEYWIGENGNQVSYTLKYKPEEVSYGEFCRHMAKNIKTVRCVSVMPQADMTAYEYQPEEPITVERYNELMANIASMKEDVGFEHIDCASGGCPVDFKEGVKDVQT